MRDGAGHPVLLVSTLPKANRNVRGGLNNPSRASVENELDKLSRNSAKL